MAEIAWVAALTFVALLRGKLGEKHWRLLLLRFMYGVAFAVSVL